MKIVHVYAKNIQMFVDAVEGTDCKLNASKDLDYMMNSLQNFNSRDVIGLVVFANPFTKKCISLIEKFDSLHVFKKMPIVVVSDAATELRSQGIFNVKYSKLFVLDSEDNTISDLDISTIFTTLLAYTDSVYDLTLCPAEKSRDVSSHAGEASEKVMSEQLTSLLEYLKGGTYGSIKGSGCTKEK